MMGAATAKTRRTPSLLKLIGTRRGALTVAGLAAVLAAVGFAVFLSNYRDSVRGGAVPTQVLVADRLIPAGTSGDAVATGRLFKPTTVSADDVTAGAITDAAVLHGTVATRDLYPGRQITAADFRAGADPLRGELAATQRALAVPLDQAHGLVGDVRSGDRVDVFASFPNTSSGEGTLETVVQDAMVLKAPERAESATDENSVVLRTTDGQAARIAYAVDNGEVWITLRAPAGGSESAPATVTRGNVSSEVGQSTDAGFER
jgi:Flp pilus assembly protein CpaB